MSERWRQPAPEDEQFSGGSLSPQSLSPRYEEAGALSPQPSYTSSLSSTRRSPSPLPAAGQWADPRAGSPPPVPQRFSSPPPLPQPAHQEHQAPTQLQWPAAAVGSPDSVCIHPGRLRALSVSHRKSGSYGSFVRARWALNSQKRWIPARAVRVTVAATRGAPSARARTLSARRRTHALSLACGRWPRVRSFCRFRNGAT
jgi:hypothetical protein